MPHAVHGFRRNANSTVELIDYVQKALIAQLDCLGKVGFPAAVMRRCQALSQAMPTLWSRRLRGKYLLYTHLASFMVLFTTLEKSHWAVNSSKPHLCAFSDASPRNLGRSIRTPPIIKLHLAQNIIPACFDVNKHYTGRDTILNIRGSLNHSISALQIAVKERGTRFLCLIGPLRAWSRSRPPVTDRRLSWRVQAVTVLTSCW